MRLTHIGRANGAARRLVLASILAGTSAGMLLGGCASPSQQSNVAPANRPKADWSKVGGGGLDGGGQNVRSVPETPTEVTGVPYVRSMRLGWSKSEDVPTWEPENQTRHIPTGALQAVLSVDLRNLPDGADLRVNWYAAAAGGEPVFADRLETREDGEHYFSLTRGDNARLLPLPDGAYRVEVRDGATVIKSIPFDVGQ